MILSTCQLPSIRLLTNSHLETHTSLPLNNYIYTIFIYEYASLSSSTPCNTAVGSLLWTLKLYHWQKLKSWCMYDQHTKRKEISYPTAPDIVPDIVLHSWEYIHNPPHSPQSLGTLSRVIWNAFRGNGKLSTLCQRPSLTADRTNYTYAPSLQ
jgi:hypothetical protein